MASTPSPRLECLSATKTFPSGGHSLTVLKEVNLTVYPGEFVAILGPSGSGKSTLLSLMAGLERVTSGSVRVDGQPLEESNEDQLALLRRQKIGFVFQTFQLLDNLTAHENVLLPLELLGFKEARRRTDDLLRSLGIYERRHHYPAELSGGEQQRVAIARAFGPQPSLLLVDEPTGSLDRKSGQRVLDLLVGLRKEENATLLLVTHDLAIASRAERQVHLDGGRIVRDGAGARTLPYVPYVKAPSEGAP